MVTIRYDKPKKLASMQSAFVSFFYKPVIVNVLRSMPERVWLPKTKQWEIPYNLVNELQNKLPKEKFNIIGEPIDNSSYTDKTIDKVYSLPKELKTSLYDYQQEDYQILMNNDKCLLLYEMGLGKTIEIITVALKRKELGQIKHCLIVCGVNTIKYTLAEEVKKHTGMNALVLGSRRNKKGMWNTQGTAEKLEDLENLSEFFIITNIESLRNKDIKEKIKWHMDKGNIGMMVIDECHRCFAYDTRVMTNKGYLKIGDIVTNKLNVLVASYNENTGVVEYKPILNYYGHKPTERRIRLRFKYENNGYTKEIICTENHKIYTKNRGWVSAKDLTENDEFVEFAWSDKTCLQCGNVFSGMSEHHNGIVFCSKHCSAMYRNKHYPHTSKQRDAARNNLKKLWKDPKYRAKKSEESRRRMLANNPVYMEGVVEKAKQSRLKSGPYTNNFKYGNGKVSPYEAKVRDLLPSNFIYNYAISTSYMRKEHPEMNYPTNYKPDFTDPVSRICIEIDGSNHRSRKDKQRDEKKDTCLKALGYTIFRFTHSDVDSDDFARRLLNVCKVN